LQKVQKYIKNEPYYIGKSIEIVHMQIATATKYYLRMRS
jgi:hypothetical protein